MYDLPLRSAPSVALAGEPAFAVEFVHNGGTGARPDKDGLSATAFPSGVYGSQVEIAESVAPVIFHRRELRTDSGGAGRFRGGLGQHIELSPGNDRSFLAFMSLERVKFPAAGRAGGGAGAAGSVRIKGGGPLPGKGEIEVKPGDTLVLETPGGGGFGVPGERDGEALANDVRTGLVSARAARDLYGFEVSS